MQAASMDFPELLLPYVPIIHYSQKIFQATVVGRFSSVGRLWHVHMKGFIEELHL